MGLEDFYFRKLKSYIEFAYKYSPFYRKKYKNANFRPSDFKALDDIGRIPIITKKEFRENYKEIITLPYRKFLPKLKKIKYPIKIAWNPQGKFYTNYVFIRNLFRMGYKPYYKTVVYYHQDFRKYFFHTLGLFRFIVINSKLSEEKQMQYIKKIKPKQMLYNPLSLFEISQIAEEKKIILQKPDLLITKAEILPDFAKAQIEKIFGPSLDFYGAEEVGYVAWQNVDEMLYNVNWDNVFLESLDMKSNEPILNENDFGKLVVTSLHNLAMPVIRYEIGDVAKVIPSNGYVLKIKSLEGKHEDCLFLKKKIITPLNLTNILIREINGLFVLITGKRRIVILTKKVIDNEKVAAILRKYNLNRPLKIVNVKEVPKTLTGKYYTIIKSLDEYI